MKRIVIAVVVLVVVVGGGLAIWARSALGGDAVRTAVARQMSEALGAPVTIGGLTVSVLPRVSIDLSDVAIGAPARVTVSRLRLGTALGALFSRRIEQATVRLEGARLELPIAVAVGSAPGAGDPAAGSAGSAGSGSPVEAAPAVTLVSIDDIALSDVEIVSGGRSLKGEAALRWRDGQLAIERATLTAGDAAVEITGSISDVNGPVGALDVRSPDLDVLNLVEFFSAFTAGATPPVGVPVSAPSPSPAAASSINLTMQITAGRARFGALAIEEPVATARVAGDAVRMEPIAFRVFGGSTSGALTLGLGPAPRLVLDSTLTGIDVAAAMAFAGSPDTVTGRASGRLGVEATGVTAEAIVRTAVGTARLDVTDGSVRGLGLVRQAVLATSMRADSQAQAATAGSEAFSRLGLTAQIARGQARTEDLRFESPDVLLAASGVVQLASTVVDLAGAVQLSNELSKSAGRDLVRYTQQDGRVTLPVTVKGPASALSVSVDVADATKRAITNRATEEAKKALSKTLGRIIR